MDERFIGKYEIVNSLGKGSMGVVYQARDPEIGRLVAIKTLKAVFLGDDATGNEAMQRFRQESRAVGKLQHPNIVTIFEAGRTENGSPYIVMEFIEGRSLDKIVADDGPLEPLRALHYLSQIASAVDYAISQNVIHRDIKPSNIIVGNDHRPHLLDFGVAKLSDTSLTPAGTVVGTPSYMSPEQIRGEKLDGRTDFFSFAVVVYESLTGVRPFPGSDFTTVVGNIIHSDPIPFSELDVELPNELEGILRRSLSKKREDRYPSALELIDQIAKVFGVTIDGSGLVGGFSPDLTLADVQATNRPKSTAAQTLHTTIEPRIFAELMSGPDAQVAHESSLFNAAESKAEFELGSLDNQGSYQEQNLRNSQLPFAGKQLNGAELAVGDSGIGGAGKGPVNGVNQLLFTSPVHETSSLKEPRIASFGKPSPTSLENEAEFPVTSNYLPQRRTRQGNSVQSLALKLFGFVVVVGLVILGGRFLLPHIFPKRTPLTGEDTQVAESTEQDIASKTEGKGRETAVALVAEPDPEVQIKEENIGAVDVLSPKPLLPLRPDLSAEEITESNILQFSDAEIAYLLDANDTDLRVLRLAVAEAGTRTHPSFTGLLSAVTVHPNSLVRVEVLKALSKPSHYETEEGMAAIVRCLNDKEYLVRGFAVKVLSAIGDVESYQLLEVRRRIETNDVVKKVLDKALSERNG